MAPAARGTRCPSDLVALRASRTTHHKRWGVAKSRVRGYCKRRLGQLGWLTNLDNLLQATRVAFERVLVPTGNPGPPTPDQPGLVMLQGEES